MHTQQHLSKMFIKTDFKTFKRLKMIIKCNLYSTKSKQTKFGFVVISLTKKWAVLVLKQRFILNTPEEENESPAAHLS